MGLVTLVKTHLGSVWIFFHHSIFVTHYLSFITQNILPVWHHHSLVIIQYFSYCLWTLYLSLSAVFFFNFVSPNPMKKNKKGRKRSHLVWKEKVKEKEKEKKDEETHAPNPKRDGQKLQLKSDNRSLHVVIYRNVIELWVIKTKNG